ncbi:legume-like lectin family-domain-containing protein [Baffinella frigidus]|nr:legume-like lectin family-domain-containing protein [Cryptophyta sp. CCMP2293]
MMQPRSMLALLGVAASLSVVMGGDAKDRMTAKEREVSFSGPFRDGGVEGWDFLGSAVVTDHFVRLTPTEGGNEGALWSKARMPFKEWQVVMEFKIAGQRYLGGDGMVLWFTEGSQVFGGTFGNQQDFKGLGIVFDTYDNDGKRDNPSILAISSDGTLRFNHDEDGSQERLPGGTCKINYRNPRAAISVRVTFQHGALSVAYDVRNKQAYTECFRVSGVTLPEATFLGVTAHTGQVADNHDLYSITTTSLDHEVAIPLDPPPTPTVATTEGLRAVQEEGEGKLKNRAGNAAPISTDGMWSKDDDRHLTRFGDAILKYQDMTPDARTAILPFRDRHIEKLREKLEEQDAGGDRHSREEGEAGEYEESFGGGSEKPFKIDGQIDGQISDSGGSGRGSGEGGAGEEGGRREEDRRVGDQRRDEEERAASERGRGSGAGAGGGGGWGAGAGGAGAGEVNSQHFKDEVRNTLSIIQAEIKEIAQEMRGTITLAHAVSRDSGGDGEGSGGGGGGAASGSELLVAISEAISNTERALHHDMASVDGKVSGIRNDVAELHGVVHKQVIRHNQEVSSKLSTVGNDVAKILEAVKELQKRTDYHAGKLVTSQKQLHETVHSKLEERITEAAASSPLLFVLCSQLPWAIP